MTLDGGNLHQDYINASQELALSLNGNKSLEVRGIQRSILTSIEKRARLEEETMTLTTELLDAARTWGVCGFQDESNRIWNEIATVACGVYSRKDYQFSEILLPLELAHRDNPEGSKERIIEQLNLAHQLEEAVSGKQLAIAIEDIIELLAEWNPELAFKALVEEDQKIFRERTLDKAISKLVLAEGTDKHLLLAIIKTFSRWENYRHFNDETRPAMESFFISLLKNDDIDVALETYRFARHVFIVEKRMPHLVKKWASIWEKYAPPNDLITQDKNIAPEEMTETDSSDEFEKERKDIRDKLKEIDTSDIKKVSLALMDLSLKDEREDLERKISRSQQDLIKAFLNASSLREVPKKHTKGAKGILDKFSSDILSLWQEDTPTRKESSKKLLENCLLEFCKLLGVTSSYEELGKVYGIDAWLDELGNSSGLSYKIKDALGHMLPQWIETAPFSSLDNWLEFIRDQTSSDSLSHGLLAVAKRYKNARREQAFLLLEEARNNIEGLFFEYGKLSTEICKLAIEIDKNSGNNFVLECFQNQYSKYPATLILKLDKLLKLIGENFSFSGVELYYIWSKHNQRLAEGLSPKKVNLEWMHEDTGESIEYSCIKYLLSLLRYPEIDIRLLAVEALVELLATRNNLIEIVQDLWPQLTPGQKEYVASVLESLGHKQTDSKRLWAEWLIDKANEETHYNLKATVANAVARSSEHEHLDNSLYKRADMLLEPPKILQPIPPTIVENHLDPVSIPQYMRWVLETIYPAFKSPALAQRVIFEKLYGNYPNLESGLEEEYAVHRHHNINSNFDDLEISADFDEACRSTINQSLIRLMHAHEIDLEYLKNNSDILRLRDSSDNMIKKVSPPDRINWLAQSVDDEKFIKFEDFEQTISCALGVKDNFIPLFEYTEERKSYELTNTSSRVCKVQVEIFGISNGFEKTSTNQIKSLFFENRVRERNRYRFELANSTLTDTHPFVPLVVTTSRGFRGRRTPDLADISAIWKKLGAIKRNPVDILGTLKGSSILSKSIEWQDEFDQDRRLHEPRSAGYLLEVDYNFLKELSEKLDFQLFACIKLERTTDKYKPEFQMDWHKVTKVISLDEFIKEP